MEGETLQTEDLGAHQDGLRGILREYFESRTDNEISAEKAARWLRSLSLCLGKKDVHDAAMKIADFSLNRLGHPRLRFFLISRIQSLETPPLVKISKDLFQKLEGRKIPVESHPHRCCR